MLKRARKEETLARIRAAGVVGAGGSGFPTYFKLRSRCDTVIANGAECEPLLAKDHQVMERRTDRLLDGLARAAELVGAKRRLLAVKEKQAELLTRLQRACAREPGVEVRPLTDTYPAGDEVVLVYELTGRRTPPGGFPTEVGVLVQNVETLLNLSRAFEEKPVTETWLTVCGAVPRPFTAPVPVGTRVGELLALAGGGGDLVAMEGGAMMGQPVLDQNRPVTKTTAGLLFLPRDHRVIRFATRSEQVRRAVNRSACDQCSYCTQLCPRYLLGYGVEPHLVMRGSGFGAGRQGDFDPYGRLCCECGICELYACPEDLSPREACRLAKRRAVGPDRPEPVAADRGSVHPLRGGRQVPVSLLKKRLDLRRFDLPAPYRELPAPPERVAVLHRQHAGAAGRGLLRPGQTVGQGEIVAEVGAEDLGVPVHAPFAGVVVGRTGEATEIERSL